MDLYDENTEILFSPYLAEPLYEFVTQLHYNDYMEKNAHERISIAQYVYMYELKAFAAYCKSNGYI